MTEEKSPVGVGHGGRLAYYDKHWGSHELDCVMLQEARAQGPCPRDRPNYSEYASGTSDGNAGGLGTEVWVRKGFANASLNGGRPLAAKNVVPVAEQPRMTMVAIRVPSPAMDAMSAHAPHAGHGRK